MRVKMSVKNIAALKPQGKPYEVVDTEVQGLILRVQPSGVMTFYVQYRTIDGRRNRVKLGAVDVLSLPVARDMALDKLAQVRMGQNPAEERKAARVMPTLGAFMDPEEGDGARNWLALRRSGTGTLARLKACFKKLWNTPLDGITQGAVERWRASRIADGVKAATVNRDVAALKTALTKAVHWGIIDKNPLANLKPLRVDSAAKIRFLSPDEETRLLKALDAREERLRKERDNANTWRRDREYPELPDLRRVAFADYLKPLVLLSLHTGVRRGEAFSLEWCDVDLDRGVLTVAGKTAKSGKTRHIPLNSFIRGVLTDWRAQSVGEGLVFPSPVTGNRLDNTKKAWAALLDEAKDDKGKGIEDFRWHDLRHSFASKLVMAGVDLNTVRDLLGHASITMTLRYSHLAPEVRAAAVERLVIPEGKIVQFKGKGKGKA